MSTIIFDKDRVSELQDQKIQHPWRKRPRKFTWSVALAVVVPALVAAFLLFGTDIPDPLVMILVYLPLQLVAAALAAVVSKGKHGIADSVIATPRTSANGIPGMNRGTAARSAPPTEPSRSSIAGRLVMDRPG